MRRFSFSFRCLAVLSSVLLTAGIELPEALAQASPPIQLHPQNPRYFLFRGRPLVLLTATEHYGSVMNRPFNYQRYLDDLVDKRMTFTRTFLLYRELQTPRNPYSTSKPESPDYIAPWPRTGPGKALDKEPIYDLDQWNEEYFVRLHDFLTAASERGIVVELTLFSHTYNDGLYNLNPLRAPNNKQQVGTGPWQAYDSLKDPVLVERQKAYARKIVQETSGFDNIYYEICNEPAGNVKDSGVTTADVDAWLAEMNATVRAELKKLGRKHLIFGAECFDVGALAQHFETTFSGKLWDAVILHPSTYVRYRGRNYRMGDFMSKQLTLRDVRDFCVDVAHVPKPLVSDEDNAASMYRDPAGWTIHRKRAWATVISGAHYDFIDFSIRVGQETGTAESNRMLRTWFKHLSTLIHSFDFIRGKPGVPWLRKAPRPALVSTMVVEGEDYLAYLADARELSDPAAGSPIAGAVEVDLPGGTYEVRLYSPTTGGLSPAVRIEGGKPQKFELLPFEHDIVVRATRLR